MALTRDEIRDIAVATADEVIARQRDLEMDSLMFHSVPYMHGSPGIIVNDAVAKSSPCRCIEYKPGKLLCFSRGIVGALSDEQEKTYCPTIEKLESPGLQRRMNGWMGAVKVCKAEIEPISRGERLEPWLNCMSRELAARGIETSPVLQTRRYGEPLSEEARAEEHARRYGPSAPLPPRGQKVQREMVAAGV